MSNISTELVKAWAYSCVHADTPVFVFSRFNYSRLCFDRTYFFTSPNVLGDAFLTDNLYFVCVYFNGHQYFGIKSIKEYLK